MKAVNRIRDYFVAFATVGSWASIFVMLFFAEQYVNPGRVLAFLAISIVVSVLSSFIFLLLVLKRRILQFPRITLLAISIPAIISSGYTMYYNQSATRSYYGISAKILEKGFKKSKQKMPNHGAFWKIRTQFDTFDIQVPDCNYANKYIGDNINVNAEIGKLQFTKINL